MPPASTNPDDSYPTTSPIETLPGWGFVHFTQLPLDKPCSDAFPSPTVPVSFRRPNHSFAWSTETTDVTHTFQAAQPHQEQSIPRVKSPGGPRQCYGLKVQAIWVQICALSQAAVTSLSLFHIYNMGQKEHQPSGVVRLTQDEDQ